MAVLLVVVSLLKSGPRCRSGFWEVEVVVEDGVEVALVAVLAVVTVAVHVAVVAVALLFAVVLVRWE